MDHHAIFLTGERGGVDKYLVDFFSYHGVSQVANPDIFVVLLSTFGVDDARAVSERAIERSFGKKKFFVIRSDKYTPEAQNALLKTLEDPIPNTHFVVFAEDTQILLPTLLSRMLVVRVGDTESVVVEAKKFLESPYAKRIAMAQKFADKKNIGKYPSLSTFLDSLLLELREKKVEQSKLAQVLKLRGYALDPAVLPRLILEHLALVI